VLLHLAESGRAPCRMFVGLIVCLILCAIGTVAANASEDTPLTVQWPPFAGGGSYCRDGRSASALNT
jgi:hypothetical protein